MNNETARATVMVVDDTPDNLSLLEEILQKAGYRVVSITDGEEALKKAAQNPPDVILLDILMPGMDGFEVCRRLKADDRLKEIPVLFLSALIEEGDKVKAFSVGGVDYMTKPFYSEEVLSRLDTHLRLHRLTLDLEAIVKERTVQLEESNRALKQEIIMRAEAEKHLRANRAMLASVFEGISEPLLLVGRDKRVKLMNRRASEYYNTFGEQLPSSEGTPAEKVNTEIVDLADGVMAKAVSEGVYQVYERMGAVDSQRIEQVFIYPVEENGSKTGDVIVRIMDVTKDRRLRQEVAQADKMIALGTLVAGVAHEINNPNHIILLNIPILAEVWNGVAPILEEHHLAEGDFPIGAMNYSEIKAEIPELISETASSAERIKRIVSVLKDYSAKDDRLAKTDAMALPPVDVNQAMANTVLLLKHKINRSTTNFNIVYGEKLPAVRADQQKLEQVFINLISNALESLRDHEGGVYVRSYWDSKKREVSVEIRDEGNGISPDSLSRIMDPFYTTKRGQGGTGLGLFIVQQIVFHHGGRIDVKSREGEGSTFVVTLPATPQQTEAPL